MSAHPSAASVAQLHDDLLACQRQALLGTLSGIIVHEYNNLMTPVLIRAQDALARDDVAVMKKALAVTTRQTQTALDFSRQVLQVARGEDTQLRSCPLKTLVDAAVLAAVRPFDKDGIELCIDVSDDLRIQARPAFFVQALLNLLLNARNAMKNRRGTLKIGARRADGFVEIAVADQGTGFTPQLLQEVINPFLRSDPDEYPAKSDAVGMGLQACRIIAWRHGAAIRAENNDGPGSTFYLSWPAA